MGNPKRRISKQGKPMHYSVGALIKKGNKYLLIEICDQPYFTKIKMKIIVYLMLFLFLRGPLSLLTTCFQYNV